MKIIHQDSISQNNKNNNDKSLTKPETIKEYIPKYNKNVLEINNTKTCKKHKIYVN